jgi:hypothetical protein
MWVRERGRKFTCVTLDDHPANGQSKSHATSFRRDEGVEYVAGKFTGEITASSDRSVVNLASGPQHHGDFRWVRCLSEQLSVGCCLHHFAENIPKKAEQLAARFGSLADISPVRPMSALPPKADIR